jgi:hypothetical protein
MAHQKQTTHFDNHSWSFPQKTTGTKVAIAFQHHFSRPTNSCLLGKRSPHASNEFEPFIPLIPLPHGKMSDQEAVHFSGLGFVTPRYFASYLSMVGQVFAGFDGRLFPWIVSDPLFGLLPAVGTVGSHHHERCEVPGSVSHQQSYSVLQQRLPCSPLIGFKRTRSRLWPNPGSRSASEILWASKEKARKRCHHHLLRACRVLIVCDGNKTKLANIGDDDLLFSQHTRFHAHMQ